MSHRVSWLRQRAFECTRSAGGQRLQYADRDDAAQDAVVALLEAKSPVQSELAYVIGAARIHVARRLRDLVLARRRSVPITCSPAPEPDVVQDLIRNEEARRVRAMVREMRPHHRRTLAVLLQVGYSSAIVAQVFGIDRAHARVRMHRAIAEVRARCPRRVEDRAR